MSNDNVIIIQSRWEYKFTMEHISVSIIKYAANDNGNIYGDRQKEEWAKLSISTHSHANYKMLQFMTMPHTAKHVTIWTNLQMCHEHDQMKWRNGTDFTRTVEHAADDNCTNYCDGQKEEWATFSNWTFNHEIWNASSSWQFNYTTKQGTIYISVSWRWGTFQSVPSRIEHIMQTAIVPIMALSC